MASSLFSRLLPRPSNSTSIYETVHWQDNQGRIGSMPRYSIAIDEENLGEHFHDHDLEDFVQQFSSPESKSVAMPPGRKFGDRSEYRAGSGERVPGQEPEVENSGPGEQSAEEDDDVPESLLMEGDKESPERPWMNYGLLDRHHLGQNNIIPLRSISRAPTNPTWRNQSSRPESADDFDPTRANSKPRTAGTLIADPLEKAKWQWANVQNLDYFLKQVYQYYISHGIWSILLRRTLNLLTIAFIVIFTTILTMCLDYGILSKSKSLSEIHKPRCIRRLPFAWNVFLCVFSVLWMYYLINYILDIRRLMNLKDFFQYLLDIPDRDIQTVSWQLVVERLMALRDANPVTAENISSGNRAFMRTQSKQRMDAHDIANRLMRRENYLIALFNRNMLNLTVPIPFLGNHKFFTKTIEWNIGLCVMDFVFDEQGQVRQIFLSEKHRKELIATLRRRFAFAGIMSIIFAPFLVLYYCLTYFFMYFAEYRRNPAEICSRVYTPLAEWQFREFNELWHLFERRKSLSYPHASRYLQQFPRDKFVQLCRFVQFISGALAAVLVVASLLDPDLFLGFEITHDRTALFYFGVLTAVYAAARGAIPNDEVVPDPELSLSNVIFYTRYYPKEWHGRLHTDEVLRDFLGLYKTKILVFLEEAMSVVFTPYILLYSLPRSSEKIIDFFREFTVHVDGLGHVCSSAVFDFHKRADRRREPLRAGQAEQVAEQVAEHMAPPENGNKIMASYYGFMDNYAGPQTRPSGELRQGAYGFQPGQIPARIWKLRALESRMARGESIFDYNFHSGTSNGLPPSEDIYGPVGSMAFHAHPRLRHIAPARPLVSDSDFGNSRASRHKRASRAAPHVASEQLSSRCGPGPAGQAKGNDIPGPSARHPSISKLGRSDENPVDEGGTEQETAEALEQSDSRTVEAAKKGGGGEGRDDNGLDLSWQQSAQSDDASETPAIGGNMKPQSKTRSQKGREERSSSGRGGVMGLLYEFQRAQADGRGVNL